MALTRRFNFFDKDFVKDPLTQQPLDALKDVQVTSGCSGRGYLWFGDKEGFVHRLDRNLNHVTFRAYERCVRLCKQLKQHDLLVTVGQENVEEDKVKVWNLGKWSEGESAPFCCRIVKASIPSTSTGGESPVTCIEVMESLNYMFVGHANGTIQMFKGDVTRERNTKRRVLYEGTRAITNLGALATEQGVTLFATTDSLIFAILIGPKEQVDKVTLDTQFGCHWNCAVLLDSQKSSSNPTDGSFPFLAGCREAIYFYLDTRGPCIGLEGEKYALQHYKTNYLVVVRPNSATNITSASSASNAGNLSRQLSEQITTSTGSSSTASSSLSLLPPRGSHQVTVFDYVNKFIAAEFQLPDVKCVLSEWGGLYVLCGSGVSSAGENKLVSLVEKDTQSKLDLLFSKKSYNVAIDIAKSQHFDEEQMANLFRRYADHLYRSKEYDASIQEYIKTIGKLEPSYVIQKFLNTSRIHNLTAYLQALHKARLATGDHTTLLLNCYSKLRDEDNLNRFIANAEEMNFDVETAIRVLRQSGMTTQARDLAKRFQHHDWYLKIVLEDEKMYDAALNYIGALEFEHALPSIVSHGNVLMEHKPQKTAELLDRLCSGTSNSVRLDVSHFMRIFVSNREGLMNFLERYISKTSTTELVSGVVDTLLELYLYSLHILLNPPPDDNNHVTAVPIHTAPSKRDSVELISRSVDELQTRIMDLLRNDQMPYNPLKQLMLCHQRHFIPGYLYLCEKLKEYEPILDHYLQCEDKEKVLETCQRYGGEKNDLWLKALTFYGSRQDCEDYLSKVIAVIDECDIIPPLSVIQHLCKGPQLGGCTLGAIKAYLIRRLEKNQKTLCEFEAAIDRYRSETDDNRAVIHQLTNKMVVFQVQKCNVCNQSLDFPSVHFLCGHSFHELCFKNYSHSEDECPSCVMKNKEIKAEIERYMATANRKATSSSGSGSTSGTGLSLASSWELAFEGLGRTLSRKSAQTAAGGPSSGSVTLTQLPPLVKTTASEPSASVPKAPSVPSTSQAGPPAGNRVQTSADVHRGSAVGVVAPQLTSAVATAGQTISEATAAASNLATGFINQMKGLKLTKPGGTPGPSNGSGASVGMGGPLSGSRGSLTDVNPPPTGQAANPVPRQTQFRTSPSEPQLAAKMTPGLQQRTPQVAPATASTPTSSSNASVPIQMPGGGPRPQQPQTRPQPRVLGSSAVAASSGGLSSSVPVDRVLGTSAGNPFIDTGDTLGSGNPFEDGPQTGGGTKNPFEDDTTEDNYPKEKNPFDF